jgi:aspartate aminotransferase
MTNIFRTRRDMLVETFKSINGVKVIIPKGAFYLFPDVSGLFNKRFNGRLIRNSEDLSWYLLEEAHVATVPGTAFGTPECIRLSYATSDNNIKTAMKRIKSKIE